MNNNKNKVLKSKISENKTLYFENQNIGKIELSPLLKEDFEFFKKIVCNEKIILFSLGMDIFYPF